MPTVPGCDQAIVEPTKVAAYLLSGTHPIGRGKAKFFKRFGFRADAPDELMQALLAHVGAYAAAHTDSFAYGIKYRVDGPLDSPDGSTRQHGLDRPPRRDHPTFRHGISVLVFVP